jgi:hypothetical protein
MNTPSIFASIIFGSIGFAALIYGKKQRSLKPLGIGIALMAYPYFISNPWIVYGLGFLLTASLFIFRD